MTVERRERQGGDMQHRRWAGIVPSSERELSDWLLGFSISEHEKRNVNEQSKQMTPPRRHTDRALLVFSITSSADFDYSNILYN